ncbi:SMP-30/gluconolactonase/LRE family protein [Rudanella paleaurantiibacter]|uniref:SMP-30/gluconolactonase/LRE family protein n=1 Tax=Rudanella paleaurantiibacter TaxID=2614655 RepID=UPI0016233D33|nr:SMP-30/gluconolactonase/LRE family protein [Rudanella paleaurantiibacter]
MKTSLSIALLLGVLITGQAQPLPTIGKVVRLDPRLDKLVPKDAQIDVLASGFTWAEGPIWVKQGNYLLFSDVPQNTVFKWSEKDGLSTFLKPSGYTGTGVYSDEPGSNGLTLDAQGRLVLCEHGDRRVSVMPLSGGGKRTVADHYEGKRFNAPNDVVVHSNGSYYFTDPPYGLAGKEKDPTRETPLFGVYRATLAEGGKPGRVSLLIDDLTRPNGITFSPDEKTLYIAQSDPNRPVIMAYPMQPDGSVGKGRVFFDASALLKQNLPGLPDGLKTDRDGNVWSTGPGGVLVIAPDGTLLGRIDTGQATANCGWGDADGRTLYITADGYLCRIRTTARGW